MKRVFLLLSLCLTKMAFAQDKLAPANPNSVNQANQKNTYILPIAKMSIKGSHPISVGTDKTIHIVFPAEIKEVDLGVPEVLSQITPAFNNVLKIKSIGIFNETNLTVLTSTGDLYSFILNYDENPEILNIDIEKNYQSDAKTASTFNFSTFTRTNFLIPEVDMSENEIRSNINFILGQKKQLKNIGIKNLNVGAYLHNLYMDNTLMYFSVKVVNNSGVSYPIDFVKLYVRDVETAKRQTIQEEELPVILLDKVDNILAQTSREFVVAIPRITISSDKQIELEIYEAKGGRHLRFPINSKIVSNAKTLNRK